MKTTILFVIATVFQMGYSANMFAPESMDTTQSEKFDCLDIRYTNVVFPEAIHIPDNAPDGILIGPVQLIEKERFIRDVVLELGIYHPQTGDLEIALHYDADNDGLFEASSPVEFHLVRLDACGSEELCGCLIELDGTYYFKDEGWGIYDETASFRVFDGFSAGGSFYLSVVDSWPHHEGVVDSWGV
jgi:hypothetical protein